METLLLGGPNDKEKLELENLFLGKVIHVPNRTAPTIAIPEATLDLDSEAELYEVYYIGSSLAVALHCSLLKIEEV